MDDDDNNIGQIPPPKGSLTEVDDQETVKATDDDVCHTFFHCQLFTVIVFIGTRRTLDWKWSSVGEWYWENTGMSLNSLSC